MLKTIQKCALAFFLLQNISLHAQSSVGFRLNEVQMKGSHNSYHLEPLLPFHSSHRYSHPSLSTQLGELKIRQFELDIHWNSFKQEYDVYHIPIIDQKSTCSTLKKCLLQMAGWSFENPGHEPLFIFIEPKFATRIGANRICDKLDEEISSVVPRRQIFAPRDLVLWGNSLSQEILDVEEQLSIKETVLQKGWPLFDSLRGKFIFVLLDDKKVRDAYVKKSEMLMFPMSDGDAPYSAIISLNNPIDSKDQIRKRIKQGFIVRTLTDSQQAPRDVLLSGAHLISTDDIKPGTPNYFPLPNEEIWIPNPYVRTLQNDQCPASQDSHCQF